MYKKKRLMKLNCIFNNKFSKRHNMLIVVDTLNCTTSETGVIMGWRSGFWRKLFGDLQSYA